MIAHLDALRGLLSDATGLAVYVGEVPSGSRLGYGSLWVPGFDLPDEMTKSARTNVIDANVRFTVAHSELANVLHALNLARQALFPTQRPYRLDVPDHFAEVRWRRHEGSAIDRDAGAIVDTKEHPVVGTDTYWLHSQPV